MAGKKNDDRLKAAVEQIDPRIWSALCPDCNARHTLTNGTVWFFCGLERIIKRDMRPGIPEPDVLAMIRERFGPPPD